VVIARAGQTASKISGDSGTEQQKLGSKPEVLSNLPTAPKPGNLKEKLQELADKNKKSIVFSPKTREMGLDAEFQKSVTLEEALKALRGMGCESDEEGNIVRVYTQEEHDAIQEAGATRDVNAITLYYVTAEEVIDLVAPLLSKGGVIRAGPITRKTGERNQAQPMRPSSATASSGGSMTPSRTDPNDLSTLKDNKSTMQDVVVVWDYKCNIERVRKVINQIDQEPNQVLVEVTILSARLTEEMTLGVDWNLLTGADVDGFPALDGGSGTPIASSGFTDFGDQENGLRIGVSSGNLQGFIRALEAVTDITIHANPKILAINKQEASMRIGANLAYRGEFTIGTNRGTPYLFHVYPVRLFSH
jgi:type II secretory pathway component GspD/PulD (secretin)